MGRLNVEFLSRVEQFADRVLALTATLAEQRRPLRLIDQIASSGTSVGANCFEADQAVSRRDFCRALGIATKELSETRFWIRLVSRQGWVAAERLAPLEVECLELQRVLNSMIIGSRRPHRRETGAGGAPA